MFRSLKTLGAQVEISLTGSLLPAVRRNMHVEMAMSVAYGAFYAAAIGFIPVVLRRMDATPTMLGVYASVQFLGSIFASLSIVLMRRRRPRHIIFSSWLVARSLFLFTGLITQAHWMIALAAIFWLLEVFPSPGYTRILQHIYPDQVRGKVMSVSRMGRVSTILLITPLAGWALDHWGYRILFPLAGVLGIVAALIFTRLEVQEDPLPPRQTRTLPELWQIMREDRRFAFYLTSFSIFGTGTIMSWTIYPLVQVDRLHLSYSQLGWLGLVQGLFWLLGFFVWGRLIDHYGGLVVLRTTCAIAIVVPLTYIWAQEGWMLLPAFVAQGLVNAGFDMGPVNSGIQLADPKRITEYAALQSTSIGVRGMLMSLVGVGLLELGLPDTFIFALSAILMSIAWVMFGRIHAPRPGQPEFATRAPLRYRWPLRHRNPRT